MRPIATAAALALTLLGAFWLLRSESKREPRIVELGEPLPLDETVRLRWVEGEANEEEVWTVTKRETSPEEHSVRPLPTPDPDAASHQPDESARALHGMALESWRSGQIPQAMEQFEQAIELDPDDPLPRTHYGRLLVLAMSYRDALPHLERAAELTPGDPQVWLDLATLHEKSLVLDRSWAARRRAEELADGREIRRQEMGFWVVDGTSIYP